MALFKRGKYWYCTFRLDGVRHQWSTRLTSRREAERAVTMLKAYLVIRPTDRSSRN